MQSLVKSNRTALQRVKRIILYILTFPQIFIHKIRGVEGNYDDLATFFRYFPLGRINKDKTISFHFMGRTVTFFYGHQSPMSGGIFRNGEYDVVPVKNKVVVDIGAALGDTAIYFALKGAVKVYGYELNKRHFDIAQKNIDLNNLQHLISIEYCGIAKNRISSTNPVLGALMSSEDAKHVDAANYKTLDSIATENNLSDAVLKIDVDGFEYEIMDSVRQDTLRRFEYIYMEYHFGVQRIDKILSEAGFDVTIKEINKIRVDSHPHGYKEMDIGFLVAKRRGLSTLVE